MLWVRQGPRKFTQHATSVCVARAFSAHSLRDNPHPQLEDVGTISVMLDNGHISQALQQFESVVKKAHAHDQQVVRKVYRKLIGALVCASPPRTDDLLLVHSVVQQHIPEGVEDYVRVLSTPAVTTTRAGLLLLNKFVDSLYLTNLPPQTLLNVLRSLLQQNLLSQSKAVFSALLQQQQHPQPHICTQQQQQTAQHQAEQQHQNQSVAFSPLPQHNPNSENEDKQNHKKSDERVSNAQETQSHVIAAFDMFISHHAATNQFEKVIQTYEEMATQKHHTRTANTANNTANNAANNAANFNANATVNTNNHYARALFKTKNFQKAFDQIQAMCCAHSSNNVCANTNTLNVILEHFAMNAELSSCLLEITKFKEAGVLPDKNSFHFVLKCCTFHTDLDQTFQILSEMHQHGVEIDSRIYLEALECCAKTSSPDTQILKLFDFVSSLTPTQTASSPPPQLPTSPMIADTLRILSKSRDSVCVQKAKGLYHTRVRPEQRDSMVCLAMVRVCCMEPSLEDALEIVSRDLVHAGNLPGNERSSGSKGNGVWVEVVAKACKDVKEGVGHVGAAKRVGGNDVEWAVGEILRLVQVAGVVPDVKAFHSLLSATANNLPLLTTVFEKMHDWGVKPDDICLNTALQCAAKQSDLDFALDVFVSLLESKRPNCRAWVQFMSACVASSEANLALWAFDQLRAQRLLDSHPATWITALKACVQLGTVSAAMSILQTSRAHLKTPPGAEIYTTALGACIAAEDNDTANTILFRAIADNVRDTGFFNEVLRCRLVCGKFKEAFEVRETMKSLSVAEDHNTLDLLLQVCGAACSQAKQTTQDGNAADGAVPPTQPEQVPNEWLQLALKTFEEFLTARSVQLPPSSFARAVQVCAAAAEPTEATRLWGVFAAQNPRWDWLSATQLVQQVLAAFAATGDAGKGCDFLVGLANNHNEGPGIRCVNHLLNLYAQTGQTDEAVALLMLMLGKPASKFPRFAETGVKPSWLPAADIVSFNCTLKGCRVVDDPQLALELFSHLRGCGLQPDDTTFGTIIPLVARHGLEDQTWQLYNTMLDARIVPTVTIFHALLQASVATGNMHHVPTILNHMHRCGVAVDATTESLLVAISRQHPHNAAVHRCIETYVTQKAAKRRNRGSRQENGGSQWGGQSSSQSSDDEDDLKSVEITGVGFVERSLRQARKAKRLRKEKITKLKALHTSKTLRVVQNKGRHDPPPPPTSAETPVAEKPVLNSE